MTLTVKQVAEKYGVTENSVLTWIHNGELKAFNVGRQPGKKKPRWRVADKSLQEFEEIRSAEPPKVKRPTRRRSDDFVSYYK